MGIVVFRLDDIQDDWLVQPQIAVMNLFRNNKHGSVPLSIGVIGRAFRKGTAIVEFVCESIENNKWDCEIVCHGFSHRDFSALHFTDQCYEFDEFFKVIKDVLPGYKVESFIPPFNRFNSTTMSLVKKYEFSSVSALPGINTVKDLFTKPALLHCSTSTSGSQGATSEFRTADFVIEEIEKQLQSKADWCVVMMHPQEFSILLRDEVNDASLQEMQIIIDWCVANNHELTTLSCLQKKTNDLDYISTFFNELK
ncbi:MAG: hypothetical protein V4660_06440 [Pseudomonadota bacterium]